MPSPEFLSKVHQALNPSNKPPAITWTDIAFTIVLTIAVIAGIIMILDILLPNRASRTAILCGLAGTCVSSLYPAVLVLMILYAIATEDVDLIMATIMPSSLIPFLFYVSVCIQWRSTIQLPSSFFACCFTFIYLFITSIINFHFATHLFPMYTLFNPYLTIFIIFFYSGTLTMAIDSFYNFLEVITAEKLNIMKDFKVVGHLVKKGSEWVEIKLENVEKTSKLSICPLSGNIESMAYDKNVKKHGDHIFQ